jgi:hypothetical protein
MLVLMPPKGGGRNGKKGRKRNSEQSKQEMKTKVCIEDY